MAKSNMFAGSKYFVNPEDSSKIWEIEDEQTRIELGEEECDWVRIRDSMDMRINAKVRDTIMTIKFDPNEMGGDQTVNANVSMETYGLAVLMQNVLDWGGPGFMYMKKVRSGKKVTEVLTKIPCTPENIQKLRPTGNPFFKRVQKIIAERNAQDTEFNDAEKGSQDGDDPN